MTQRKGFYGHCSEKDWFDGPSSMALQKRVGFLLTAPLVRTREWEGREVREGLTRSEL